MCSHPGIYKKKKHLNKNLASVAGGISVGVLFCLAVEPREEWVKVNLKSRFAWRLRGQESTPGKRIPLATHAIKNLKTKKTPREY